MLNTIGFRGLLTYKITEDGAGLKMTEVDPIIESADENFRPVDAEIGADGALYVADWQNPIIGHMQHNLRDTSPRPRPRPHLSHHLQRPAGAQANADRRRADRPAARSPKEPEDRVRYRAKIELSGRNSNDVLTALTAWMSRLDKGSPQDEHLMMEALWVQQRHNRVDPALLKRMLRSSDPWARAAATRVLCYWRDRIPDAMALLDAQVKDAHPAVRLEAVRAASFFQTPDAVRIVKAVEKDLQDKFLAYTYQQSLTTLEGLAKRSTTTANAPAEANTTTTALPDCQPPRCAATCATRGCRTSYRHHPRADDVRRPLVRRRGREARALTLTNADFMPHNIVVGDPGSINPIGTAAATMPAPSAPDARAYIPTCRRCCGLEARAARPVGHHQVHRAAEAGRLQLRLLVPRPLGAHVRRHAGRAEPGRVRGEADDPERSDDRQAGPVAARHGEP